MRHKKTPKRIVEPDLMYQSKLVTQVINRIMKDGKKSVAETVMYKAMEKLKEKTQTPLDTFEKALQNVGPKQEIKARRVGGASYQVPVDVRGDRRVSLAIRWIVQAAKARPSKEYHGFAEKLAAELADAANNLGEAIKKRDNAHRQADANKAFSHFRF